MEWRGVTTTNVYVANFFFLAAMGLVISAQWELAAGNGLAYSIYSAFGELIPPASVRTGVSSQLTQASSTLATVPCSRPRLASLLRMGTTYNNTTTPWGSS